ncbi:MAG: DNA repair protein RecO [Kaiparowitsia implicata GSE-PSE-MK54-09C]|jgi:DNA repair protein RecO (recombination protein O)|nr:DNA repair protein RecO [Kaiparowitsia implicata GSE-PSE-MK54-09C]
MAGTYKATGINLKGMPLGESDRLLTVLTLEYGLIRAVAPGARKYESSLRGRSGLFVVNQLLMVHGRSLDKIIQAETQESFPGLSLDLRKLTAAQYLAELVLCQALSDQPQAMLFHHLLHYLSRLDQQPGSEALPCLVQGIYQLLTLAGVAPRVHVCCLTQAAVEPDLTDEHWAIAFRSDLGGLVMLELGSHSLRHPVGSAPSRSAYGSVSAPPTSTARPKHQVHRPYREGAVPSASGRNSGNRLLPRGGGDRTPDSPDMVVLTAQDVCLLQALSIQSTESTVDHMISLPAEAATETQQQEVTSLDHEASLATWLTVERVLRYHAQHHLERTIQSAALIEACFAES